MSQEIEITLFKDLAQIIEQGKQQVVAQVNSVLTLTYWQIGKKINEHILRNQRAEYGERVVANISKELERQYGRSYTLRNVRKMMQFAETFPDFAIVTPLVTQLSWSHFVTLLSLKTEESRLFYAQKAIEERWSKRTLAYQIERKAFERNEIATLQVAGEFADMKLLLSGEYKKPRKNEFEIPHYVPMTND